MKCSPAPFVLHGRDRRAVKCNFLRIVLQMFLMKHASESENVERRNEDGSPSPYMLMKYQVKRDKQRLVKMDDMLTASIRPLMPQDVQADSARYNWDHKIHVGGSRTGALVPSAGPVDASACGVDLFTKFSPPTLVAQMGSYLWDKMLRLATINGEENR